MESEREYSGALLIARLLIGVGQFIVPSLIAMFAWEQVELFLATYGLATPQYAVRFLGFLFTFAGFMVAAGLLCRKVSLSLLAIGVVIAFWKLRFWELEGYQQWMERTAFAHLLLIEGGLLLLLIIGPGRYAVLSNERDWRLLLPSLADWGVLVGRILIGGTLVWMAICQIVHWETTLDLLEAQGVPWPRAGGIISVLAELIGGGLILLGWRQRVGAVILITYFALTALLLHPFWAPLGMEPTLSSESVHAYLMDVYPSDGLLHARFLFDQIAIIGALLLTWILPPGRYALH